MARKFKNKKPEEIENIVSECLNRVGVKKMSANKIALLTRLIFSGISDYFFRNPDNLINMGYIQFKKNPDKEQLFAINIVKSDSAGVVNANTLWRYYKGELASETKLKGIIDEFIKELLEYSQAQEQDITNLTSRLQ